MARSSPETRLGSLAFTQSLPLGVAQAIAVLVTALALIGLTLLLNAFVFSA